MSRLRQQSSESFSDDDIDSLPTVYAETNASDTIEVVRRKLRGALEFAGGGNLQLYIQNIGDIALTRTALEISCVPFLSRVDVETALREWDETRWRAVACDIRLRPTVSTYTDETAQRTRRVYFSPQR